MVEGGNRRDEALSLNNTNIFTTLSSLKKKRSSSKNKEEERGSTAAREEPTEKEVFWAPTSLTAKSSSGHWRRKGMNRRPEDNGVKGERMGEATVRSH